jgi:sugar lactone lactonase YvrE
MPRALSFAFLAGLVVWPIYGQNQPRGRLESLKDRGAQEIFIDGRQWDLLGEGYHLTADSTVDTLGNVYFTDVRRNRVLRIDLDGTIKTARENTNGAHGVAFGPDGRLYAGQHDRKRIVAFSSDGRESVITEGVQSHHLTVTSRNHIYFTVPPTHEVWLADTAGQKRVVHKGLNWPRGVRASPDESVLIVNDPPTRWVWAFQIQADGSLTKRRRACRLETRDEKGETDAGGMAFDSEGFLYVATNMGIQVCDRQGRVSAVIDGPGESVSAVFFGGPGLQWLYVTDGAKLWRRPVKRRGTAPLNGKAKQPEYGVE